MVRQLDRTCLCFGAIYTTHTDSEVDVKMEVLLDVRLMADPTLCQDFAPPGATAKAFGSHRVWGLAWGFLVVKFLVFGKHRRKEGGALPGPHGH